jgi:hypothetical protein
MMKKMIAAVVLGAFIRLAPELPANGQNPLRRHYRDGEKLAYHMKGINEDWH